jgi:hypothetical protein
MIIRLLQGRTLHYFNYTKKKKILQEKWCKGKMVQGPTLHHLFGGKPKTAKNKRFLGFPQGKELMKFASEDRTS